MWNGEWTRRWQTRGIRAGLSLLLVLASADTGRCQDDRYALLVGVQNYNSERLPRLQYCWDDVEQLRDALVKIGFEPDRITLMTSRAGLEKPFLEPTKNNIDKQLDLLLKSMPDHAMLVIALAGHGIQEKGVDDTFFCPKDAIPGGGGESSRNLFSVRALYDLLDKARVTKKVRSVVLIDACRTTVDGDLPRSGGSKDDVATPQRLKVPGGLLVVFSCGENQRSYESKDLRHGVFFHNVIDGLRGRAVAKDGRMLLMDVVSYAMRETSDWVRVNKGESQNPELRGDGAGSVLLGRLSSSSQSTTPAFRHGQTMALDLGSGVDLTLVAIDAPGVAPSGFLMGSPDTEPGPDQDELRHRVFLDQRFWMGQTEVTVEQFSRFVADTRYVTDAEKGGGAWAMTRENWQRQAGIHWRNPGLGRVQAPQEPVVCVSWNDAVAFCDWLSRRSNVEARLPTEAEWEFCARAGTSTAWSWGNGEAAGSRYANLADQAAEKWIGTFGKTFSLKQDWNDRYETTAPVASFEANPWGLFDLHGNVWEWCQDAADWKDQVVTTTYRDGVRNPLSPEGSQRVYRGGSWYNPAAGCRSANRYAYSPGHAIGALGLRVVLARVPSDK